MSKAELYLLQSVGDLYDLSVLFPQHGGNVSAALGRHYRPGHGEVGPEGHGNGEMLECSALIKLESQETRANSITTGLKQANADQREERRANLLAGGGQRSHGLPSGEGLLRQSNIDATNRGRDFWAGHTTWRPYYAMMRTWKVYELPWGVTGSVTMSSSPGLVGYSKDDW